MYLHKHKLTMQTHKEHIGFPFTGHLFLTTITLCMSL